MKNVISTFRNNRIIKNIKNGIMLEKYVGSTDRYVRSLVAEYGSDEDRWCLKDDENWQVKTKAVVHGNNKLRTYMLKDPSPKVRESIAICGTNAHRETLKDDESWEVRYYVATLGSDEQRTYLLDDPSPRVKIGIALVGTDAHRDVLKSDISPEVRRTVVINGNDEHREYLKNDPSPTVIDTLEKYNSGVLIALKKKRKGEEMIKTV